MRFSTAGSMFGLMAMMGSLWANPAYAAPILPVYTVNQGDATWTLTGGNYTVATNTEDYTNEVWERGIEDNKWSDAGGTRTLDSDGLYRAYGDLSGAGFGVGTGGDLAGTEYLLAYWDVVGDYEHKVGSDPSDVGLKGHYYFYFEIDGSDPFLIEIPSGTALTTTYQDGNAKAYQDSAANVYGTAITTTCESTNCNPAGSLTMTGWNTEIGSPSQILARQSSPYRVEVAVPLSLLGLTTASFDSLQWAYAGVATSNPSGKNNLFANDMYSSALGRGVEYDTLRFNSETTSVPEPASMLLLGTGLLGAGVRRWRQRRA